MILFEWGKPWFVAVAIIQSSSGYQLLINFFWLFGTDITIIQTTNLTNIGISLRVYKLLAHFSLGIL